MLRMRERRIRRGTSPGAIVALIVGAVLLLAIGFVLGRSSGDESRAESSSDTTESAPASPEQRPAGSSSRARTVGSVPSRPPEPFQFEPPSIDFGLQKPDQRLEAQVAVHNVSGQPLKILRMTPDCRCTTVEDLTGRTIEPGEQVSLTAKFETPATPGPKTAAVQFVFDGYGVARFEIHAMVSRAVRADPPYFSAMEQTSGVYTLTSIDGKPFSVLAVNGDPPDYVDDFDPSVDPPRDEYLLEWDVSEYDPDTCKNEEGERMPAWWVVETDHPDAPIVDIRVRHEPCTRLDVVQRGRYWLIDARRVVFGELAPGESADVELHMEWLRDKTPNDTIYRVETESDQFHVTLLPPRQENGETILPIRVTPNPDHRGLIYGSARFYAYTEGHSQPVWFIGRVADEPRTAAAD
jgi:hypothetical protein